MATRRAQLNPKRIIVPLIALAAAVVVWYAHVSYETRFWDEYREASLRALERGNYDWAEKMARKALVEARDLGPRDPRVRQSLEDLSRIDRAQGKQALADSALALARRLD